MKTWMFNFFSKAGLFWISIIGYLGFSGFEYVGMDWYQGMDGDLSNLGYLVISGYRLWWYGLVWRYDGGFGYFGVFGYFRLLDRLVLIGMGLWLEIRVFWGIWLFPVIGN